ncbi:MAG TPA: APC family permease [Ilumatobacteraceae bacterium]|nr:APC family permease [Ilumatobacteraceae bacterium]
MSFEVDARKLAQGKLTTLDCVAQSLAVGPVFSGAVLGLLLYLVWAPGAGPFVILLTTVGILGIGWTLSEFAKRYSGTGTVYEFIAHSLGKRTAAFCAGIYHIAAISLAGPGIALIGGLWARAFFKSHMDISLDWWVWALVIAVLMYLANTLGVQVSVRAQLVLVVLSIIPFLVLFIKVVIDGGPEGNSLKSFNPSNIADGGSVFKGLLFAILMFIGFELAAALGEETKDPRRSIPIAVMATVLIVGAFYLITQYTLAVGATPDAFDFAPMADLYLNRFFAVWIDLAILLDILAVGIGFELAASRGLFTLARDGLLPAPLAKVNRRQLPANATLVVLAVTVVAVFVGLWRYGTDLIDAATGDVFFNWQIFNAFLIASRIGGFLISIVYVLLCVAALKNSALKKPVDLIAALIGLATVGLAIYSQFWKETEPLGSELWGRHLSLILMAIALIWVLASKKQAIDNVAQHTMHHT